MLWLGLAVCLFLTADATEQINYDDAYEELILSLPWMQERRRYAVTRKPYASTCQACVVSTAMPW